MRIPSRWTRTLGLTVLFAGLVAPALADVKGRASGKLLDENGDPVAGATVVVTDPDRTGFELRDETDKKGRYKVLLVDATRSYRIQFSKEGYQTVEAALKVPAGTTTNEDYTILSEAAAVQQAAAADPSGGAIALFNEAGQMANLGDYHGAKGKFEEAVALDPTLAAAHAGLALTLNAMGDPVGAAAAAEKALELEPENARALKVRVEAYEALGDAAKTAEAKEALMAADPKAAVGDLFNRAAALYNNGDMASAQPLLEQILGIDDSHGKTHYLLGLCLISSGDVDGAKGHLARFIELAPDDPDAPLAQEMIDSL